MSTRRREPGPPTLPKKVAAASMSDLKPVSNASSVSSLSSNKQKHKKPTSLKAAEPDLLSDVDEVFEALVKDAASYGSLDVMISLHCASMGPSAAWLRGELQKRGVTAWVCTDELEAGVNYRDEIYAAVKTCRVFLPLINKKWADSGECESEYLLALRTNLISHDSGKTRRTIELPNGDSVAGIRRPAMLPIKFPSLSWGSNPKVEQLGASTNFLVCDTEDLLQPHNQRTMLVKIVNGLRGLGIRVKVIEGDPPFTRMPKKIDSKSKVSPLALAQQVITGIQFQLQNTQDLFALISQGSTSSSALSFLSTFEPSDLRSQYLGFCAVDRDGCEVVWSLEFFINFVDKASISSKMDLEGMMVARPEHCVDVQQTGASAASYAKFTEHICKNESAKAYLRGTFFPSRGLAQLDAYKKEDPSALIRLCKYRILLDQGADKGTAGKRAVGLFQPKADAISDGIVKDGGDFEWCATIRLMNQFDAT
ncbi:hypothetical protein HK101_007196 [Irineochytrium annulatum]|nr:hypothetical protein HK101_007196 [Irineochytrium annulatum]